ncbi:hypothetical protein TsFJ059_009258 [Trichoderma semiorbis]|uniref:DUF4470 domain-containing protein n=1 Tax=Trichoderma semiorbis TaxID=1491008 RepID=A0A9P8KR77_9HYPO|nr:hypothetical protein TsFJ059_009258 [Trichoderma semiorbis]
MDPKDADYNADDSQAEDSYSKGEECESSLDLCCAAWRTPQQQCENNAIISCKKCRLVAYCSNECMANDLKDHHASRIPPWYPRRTKYEDGEVPDHPLWESTTFWANYPATDVLNLAKNEGSEFDGCLRLLLLGPFALRHVIYSVVAMPETANPSLDVTLRENSICHLVRTFLSLLILSLDTINSLAAAEVVVDVWYSAKWSDWTYSFIEKHVGQKIRGLYQEIQAWYKDKDEDERKLCYTASLGTPDYLTFDVCLDWHTWTDLLDCYLQEPELRSMTGPRAKDVVKWGEPLDRVFRTFSSSRTAALMKWRLDGILQPHGESASGYTIPNPAFYLLGTGLPEGITNEPLSEWPMKEILGYGPYPAEDDIYGKMNFYLRRMVILFRARLKKKPVAAHVIACGLVDLPGHIPTYYKDSRLYDRIEVGNWFDVGAQLCFLACAPLLRNVKDEEAEKQLELEKQYLYGPAFPLLETLAPPRQAAGEPYSTALLPRHMILFIYRNWSWFSCRSLFNSRLYGFLLPGEKKPQHPRAPVTVTGYLGAQMKQNTVVDGWGNTLWHSEDGKPTMEELMRWGSWPAAKPQCWLEWRKVRDVTAGEFLEHLEWVQGTQILRIFKTLYGDLGAREEEKKGEEEKGERNSGEEEKIERKDGDEAAVNEDKSAPEGMPINPLAKKMLMRLTMAMDIARQQDKAALEEEKAAREEEQAERNGGDEEKDERDGEDEEKDERRDGDEAAVNGDESVPRRMPMNTLSKETLMRLSMEMKSSREDEHGST